MPIENIENIETAEVVRSVEVDESGEKFISKQKPAVLPPPEKISQATLEMEKSLKTAEIENLEKALQTARDVLKEIDLDLELLNKEI